MGKLARSGEDLKQHGLEFDAASTSNAACTPLGCIELLTRSGVDLSKAHAVVLGRSNIVGLPVALMLLHCNATVTVCHSRTHNIEEVCAVDVCVHVCMCVALCLVDAHTFTGHRFVAKPMWLSQLWVKRRWSVGTGLSQGPS